MSSEKFDAIIVGAGPAGLAAAYTLAKAGVNAVVLERGREVGSKNVYGGRIYAHALKALMPDFPSDAPVERWIRREALTFMTENDAATLTFDIGDPGPGARSKESFTAYLPTFLQWMASKVEEAGGLIVKGATVDQLLREGNRVVGVSSASDKLLADVVIDAEGVNSLLAEQAGFKRKIQPADVAVGVKEIVKLPREVIEERFNLTNDEGLAQLFVGYPTRLPGGGFLYTNRESISLGVVVKIDPLAERKLQCFDLAEDFRQHHLVQKLLKGGSVVEYSSHMTPERVMLTHPHWDGLLVVGDAAGFLLNTGTTVRGVDFAVESGKLAAEAVKAARSKGDFSQATLSEYGRMLEASFILKELKAYKRAPEFLSTESLYADYPQVLCSLLRNLYTVDGDVHRLLPTLWRSVKEGPGVLQIVKDLIRAVRAL